MPYPLQLLDSESYISDINTPTNGPFPLTVGVDFQPGDMRLIRIFNGTPAVGASTFPGFTRTYDSGAITGWGRVSYFIQRLTSSSVDSTVTFAGSTFVMVDSITIRNPNLAMTFSPSRSTSTSGTSAPAPSVSVVAGGVLLCYWFMFSPSVTAVVPPASMTALAAAAPASAGSTQYVITSAATTITTTGSSGTKVATTAPAGTSVEWMAESLFISQNPDISVSIGTATSEVDTATAATASIPNLQTHFTIGTASEVDTASQMFTPLTGYRISPPLIMPQAPVTNSVISWTTKTPAPGSTVLVETSVDGGATWQRPVNNGAVPRLVFGTNSVPFVLTRVTLNRLNKLDATPSAPTLQVSVATDASGVELVPLGTFMITATDITMTGGGSTGGGGGGGGGDGLTGSGGGNNGGGGPIVTLTGIDLSREISRRKWEDVYFIAIGTNYATAIHDLLDNRLPGLQYNFTSTPEVVQSTLIYGDETGTDPWQDAQDLATDLGMELFFDAAGVCTLRPVPDPATESPVWEFSDTMNPVIASITRSLTDESTYNYVIVNGEQSGDLPPVQAIAFDDDPNSVTYYKGKYGIKPITYTSAAITTEAQAQEAANAILLAVKGASETLTLSASPMPALEPSDVITVTVGGVKASGNYKIQQVTTPIFAAEAQTFVLYRQSA